ncbi:MAG: hypothetical protein IK130_08175 [Oscillospiraceae bacterium]|nr:hypothetical protein [Oscillospiraceae bacterium]
MILTSLPVLLYLIPLTVLAAALVPAHRRTIPLTLGGMIYAFLSGGWECVTFMLMIMFSAWFTIRLQPRLTPEKRRRGIYWMCCGILVQIVLLILARSVVPFAGRLPLMLCAVQGIICICDRGSGKMHLPALQSYLGYSCTLPRIFAGPVISYEESRRFYAASHKPTLRSIGEGAEICVRGLFQLVLLSLPMETLWQRLRTEITLVSTPDALFTLPVIYFTLYYRLKGAVTLGEGIAHMLGVPYPESFDAPILAFSFKGYFSRMMIPLTNKVRSLLFPEGRKIDTFGYFARVLPLLAGMGLLLCDGVNGMIFGAMFAVMLTAERMALEKWLTKIPKPIRRIVTVVLLLFCIGVLYSGSQAETFNFYMILLGKNSIALSSPVIYMMSNEWLTLLFCTIGLFPLRKGIKKWEEHHSILAKCKVIAVPLLTFCVMLFCMAELFSRYLR